jgi:hypothetical protein
VNISNCAAKVVFGNARGSAGGADAGGDGGGGGGD